jgi:hypothetical protein
LTKRSASKPKAICGPPNDGNHSPYFGEYPPVFFDFIVIDGCYRDNARRKENADTYACFGESVWPASFPVLRKAN